MYHYRYFSEGESELRTWASMNDDERRCHKGCQTHIAKIECEPHGRIVRMSYTCQPEQHWDPRFRLGGYRPSEANTVVNTADSLLIVFGESFGGVRASTYSLTRRSPHGLRLAQTAARGFIFVLIRRRLHVAATKGDRRNLGGRRWSFRKIVEIPRSVGGNLFRRGGNIGPECFRHGFHLW